MLLTGNLRRWEKLPAVWRQGWRSVHNPDHVQITAEFLVEGAGLAVAQRTWPAGADFTRASVSVQVAGEKRADIDRLGWSAALADYRPFLRTASSRHSSEALRACMSCSLRSSGWRISPWLRDRDTGKPLGLDVTTPNVARMYDYYLCSKDNFEADRIAAEKVLALGSGLRRSALENRRFLRRVVRFLAAEAGVSQFLDIGVGLPTQGAVLEVAPGRPVAP